MIEPTIGRVVWYYPSDDEVYNGMARFDEDLPFDAHIVFVWSSTEVNLVVFDHIGRPWELQHVEINRPDPQSKPFAAWMPYQIGQAKRHEEEQKNG